MRIVQTLEEKLRAINTPKQLRTRTQEQIVVRDKERIVGRNKDSGLGRHADLHGYASPPL